MNFVKEDEKAVRGKVLHIAWIVTRSNPKKPWDSTKLMEQGIIKVGFFSGSSMNSGFWFLGLSSMSFCDKLMQFMMTEVVAPSTNQLFKDDQIPFKVR